MTPGDRIGWFLLAGIIAEIIITVLLSDQQPF